MIRLVFRPYTQIRRTICASVSLRASTRVSSGFALSRHSSSSFGSQHTCSNSNLLQAKNRPIMQPNLSTWYLTTAVEINCLYLHYAYEFLHSNTRRYVRLLGPCSKTGRWNPFRQNSNWLNLTKTRLRQTQTRLWRQWLSLRLVLARHSARANKA